VVARFVPLRFEEDEVFFRAGDFFALVLVDDRWALVAFFAVAFPEDLLAGDFLAEDFLAEDLAGDFREEDFRPDDFLLDDFFFSFRRSRASAAPP
jgi:hypothetical protein